MIPYAPIRDSTIYYAGLACSRPVDGIRKYSCSSQLAPETPDEEKWSPRDRSSLTLGLYLE
jgi:hypothetical protein